MLTFFTDPYPNELFYSAIARYHYYSLNTDIKETIYDLNLCGLSHMSYYASSINSFINRVKGEYCSRDIILENSTYFYFKPFLTESTNVYCVNVNCDVENGLWRSTLMNDLFCFGKRLKYCPICARLDIEKYGQAYYHIEHQLDGIEVCAKHKVLLKKSEKANMLNTDVRSNIININNIIYDEVNKYDNMCTSYISMMYDLSKLSYELFTNKHNLSNINKEFFVEYYINTLKDTKYTNINGAIDYVLLANDLRDYYGEEFLRNILKNISGYINLGWIELILEYNCEFIHPIKHLLLIKFLNKSINEIIKEISYNKPFGNGPWKCVNKFCEFHDKEVINKFKFKNEKYTNINLGVFKCDHCGMIYKRDYFNYDFQSHYVKIEKYGKLWEAELKSKLEDKRYSLYDLKMHMGCDEFTILYYKDKFGINNYSNFNIHDIDDKLKLYKRHIRKFIKSNYYLNKEDISLVYPNKCKYIRKKDFNWYNQNMPNNEVDHHRESRTVYTKELIRQFKI